MLCGHRSVFSSPPGRQNVSPPRIFFHEPSAGFKTSMITPKPQSASESQPSPASSRGSASSNDRSALKGPKSDLDEGGEDDRVRVPPSARASSAGVGRSERASMGLAVGTLLAFPSSSFLHLQILGIRGRPKSAAGRPMISSSFAGECRIGSYGSV